MKYQTLDFMINKILRLNLAFNFLPFEVTYQLIICVIMAQPSICPTIIHDINTDVYKQLVNVPS